MWNPHKKIALTFLLAAATLYLPAQKSAHTAPADILQVYHLLGEKAGFHHVQDAEDQHIPLPDLVVVPGRKLWGAVYQRERNVIELEEALIESCRKTLGNRYLDGLAFILGHELTHFYRAHAYGGFLLSNAAFKRKIEEEREADISGALYAYLAGYEIADVLREFLTGLYKDYHRPAQMQNYPSLQDRIKVADECLYRFEELKTIYRTAHYLSALGDYLPAGYLYEKVREHVNCKELNHNISVNFLLAVLRNTHRAWEQPFCYPIEMDVSDIFLPTERDLSLDRKRLLSEAESRLRFCLKTDPGYFPAYQNLTICLILQRKFRQASGILELTREQLSLHDDQHASLTLLNGIIRYYEGDTASALRRFRDARAIAPQKVSLTNCANKNIAVLLQNSEATYPAPKVSPSSQASPKPLSRGRESRFSRGYSLAETLKFHFRWTEAQTFLTINDFRNLRKRVLRINSDRTQTPKGIGKWTTQDEVLSAYEGSSFSSIKTHVGEFIIFHAEGLVFKINAVGNVEEWASFL